MADTDVCVDCGVALTEEDRQDLGDGRIQTPQGIEMYWDGHFVGYECIDCKCPTIDWSADDDVWEDIMGPWDAGHICPQCFMMRADDMNIHTTIARWYCEDCGESRG